ncbi:mucin-7-like [Panicum virgatum]|uniref:mucin-7-like n=1 Tax=Panicum virgatum TaxID=38727 RepID=UPI0019D5B68D|nr:mucin-7-like [Panicum virgatum]
MSSPRQRLPCHTLITTGRPDSADSRAKPPRPTAQQLWLAAPSPHVPAAPPRPTAGAPARPTASPPRHPAPPPPPRLAAPCYPTASGPGRRAARGDAGRHPDPGSAAARGRLRAEAAARGLLRPRLADGPRRRRRPVLGRPPP